LEIDDEGEDGLPTGAAKANNGWVQREDVVMTAKSAAKAKDELS